MGFNGTASTAAHTQANEEFGSVFFSSFPVLLCARSTV